MSDQSPVKPWLQTQLGKLLFKVYQAKIAWSRRFGRQPNSGQGAAEAAPEPVD